MIQLILGPSGSGKSTRMIEQANEEYKSRNGHIVYVDRSDSQILRLDHAVRLIDMKQYHIDNFHRLYGLLAGIMARDFDIERIYIDGLHADLFEEEGLEKAFTELKDLSAENKADFIIGLDLPVAEVPSIEGVEAEEISTEA